MFQGTPVPLIYLQQDNYDNATLRHEVPHAPSAEVEASCKPDLVVPLVMVPCRGHKEYGQLLLVASHQHPKSHPNVLVFELLLLRGRLRVEGCMQDTGSRE